MWGISFVATPSAPTRTARVSGPSRRAAAISLTSAPTVCPPRRRHPLQRRPERRLQPQARAAAVDRDVAVDEGRGGHWGAEKDERREQSEVVD